MKTVKLILAGAALALLLITSVTHASDLNEVGAMLVYPVVANVQLNNNSIETFVTITNAGPDNVVAHISYINGEERSSKYCYECDHSLLLTGNDTETLVVTRDAGGIHVASEDSSIAMTCNFPYGMIVVALEDPAGTTLTNNVLLGEEVIVDYVTGTAISIPAVPFQGIVGDGNRVYALNGKEYVAMPRIVAADFLAPNIDDSGSAVLTLFTLGFERQLPPVVDCSVTGFDARENPFSASIQFGCWTTADLCDISPEFCVPNLGLNPLGLQDTHGWVQLNCRVDSDPWAANGFDTDGGVHGAIIQTQSAGSSLAAGSGAPIASQTSWGRLLYQSVTTGDAVTLLLETPAQGLM